MMINLDDSNIILFDGVCNLCNSSVQFIIKRNKKQHFYYASLQSDVAKEILLQHLEKKITLDTIVFVEKGNIYTKSTAALRISKYLDGLWKFAYVLIIIPRPIRDIFYDFVAKKRYVWFGKRESCMMPTDDQKKMFL
ncbi:MAG: DCC1-like thiol-disulfide oxidoreductase family protein [Flavobacteriaceae bacterium]